MKHIKLTQKGKNWILMLSVGINLIGLIALVRFNLDNIYTGIGALIIALIGSYFWIWAYKNLKTKEAWRKSD